MSSPPDIDAVDRLDPRPHSHLTARVRRDVLVDRTMLRFVLSRAPRPDPALQSRVADEVEQALPLFRERGWIESPASYHVAPPTPTDVRTREKRTRQLRYTSTTWADGYACRIEEPGSARYSSYQWNRIARAALLEHRSGDRPWLVCVHGFGMGSPQLDLRAFRATHLYRTLGLNVAFLTLPSHGRRKRSRSAQPDLPGLDVLDNVHGLAQAVWDLRQLLRHLRERTTRPIAVMGLSLGGLVAAITASVDDNVHAVLLLVPAVDLTTLMVDAADRMGETDADSVELAERARTLMGPVSPLTLTPRVPVERRFIVAGTLDRFARPSTQAVALWRHWDRPEMHWYHGGHVSLFWAPTVQPAIDATLQRVGFARPRTGGEQP